VALMCRSHVTYSYVTALTRKFNSRYSDWLRVYGRKIAVRVPVGARFLSSPRRPDRFWGPPNHLAIGYREWSGLGVELTTPSSAEGKNMRSYTSTPPIPFHGVVLVVKHRDNQHI
jgi:hypothetical protein